MTNPLTAVFEGLQHVVEPDQELIEFSQSETGQPAKFIITNAQGNRFTILNGKFLVTTYKPHPRRLEWQLCKEFWSGDPIRCLADFKIGIPAVLAVRGYGYEPMTMPHTFEIVDIEWQWD